MNGERVCIIGANGQLGQALKARLPKAVATDVAELDITDWQAMQTFDWSRFDTIINAAAYTNVDGAETPNGRRLSWKINAAAVMHLTRIAVQHDLTLVHVTSETIFDGSEGPHKEDEGLAPLGVYAQTKAASDLIARVAPKHYVLRTMWLIGEGKNFVRIMMGLAEKKVSPAVVHDQTGRLTFTHTLVDAMLHLLETKAEYGAYNVSNDGDVVSWADVTRAIFAELGRDDLTVTNVSSDEYFTDKPEAAPRPLIGEFDLNKIKATGLQLRDWREDLKEYIAKEKI